LLCGIGAILDFDMSGVPTTRLRSRRFVSGNGDGLVAISGPVRIISEWIKGLYRAVAWARRVATQSRHASVLDGSNRSVQKICQSTAEIPQTVWRSPTLRACQVPYGRRACALLHSQDTACGALTR
jgi:hypothetical protein